MLLLLNFCCKKLWIVLNSFSRQTKGPGNFDLPGVPGIADTCNFNLASSVTVIGVPIQWGVRADIGVPIKLGVVVQVGVFIQRGVLEDLGVFGDSTEESDSLVGVQAFLGELSYGSDVCLDGVREVLGENFSVVYQRKIFLNNSFALREK